MKKIFLALAIAGTTATTAVICKTNTEVTTKSIDVALNELIDLLNIKENMKNTSSLMVQQMTKSMSTKDANNAVKMMSKVDSYLASDKFTDKIKAVYKKHFTAKEVMDAVAFYKSNTGKKFVNLMPQISMDMGQMIAEDMQELIADMQAEIAATN